MCYHLFATIVALETILHPFMFKTIYAPTQYILLKANRFYTKPKMCRNPMIPFILVLKKLILALPQP